MQTLVVTVHGTNGKTKKVRMMIDTGSARSYIRSDIAAELQLESAGKESVSHELFGARETKKITYQKVKTFVSDVNERDKCVFDCSVISKIANNVTFPRPGPWLQEFKKRRIDFSDADSDSSKIDILIGNDVAPRVYKKGKSLLKSGPAAIETRWGWVLSGKIFPSGRRWESSEYHTGQRICTKLNSILPHLPCDNWRCRSCDTQEHAVIIRNRWSHRKGYLKNKRSGYTGFPDNELWNYPVSSVLPLHFEAE